jgi:hypothetical protein
MPTYIFDPAKGIIDKHTGKPDPLPAEYNPPRVHVVRDYKPYRCPVTEKVIEGRRAHQENLKRTGCRLQEPGEKEQFIRERAKADAKLERIIGDAVDKTAAELGT